MQSGFDENAWNESKAETCRLHPRLKQTSNQFWREVQLAYVNVLAKGGEAGTVTIGKQRSLAKRYSFQGLPISIENAKGSHRAGVDPGGHQWKVFMHFDYGYVRGTEGADGEHLDVYVGKHHDASHAYIVHQVKPTSGEYDEDKVMLGFRDEGSAKAAYLRQYDSPKFFGGIRAIPMDAFKLMLRTHKGKRLTTGRAKRFLIKAQSPVKDDTLSQLQWEPPGGSHPQTWRAEYGGKFIYRRMKPGAGVGVEESGELYTTEEKKKKELELLGKGDEAAEERKTMRQETIKLSPEQHKKEAKKSGLNQVQKDFHEVEAQKKLDLSALSDKLKDDVKVMTHQISETGESKVSDSIYDDRQQSS